MKIATKMATKKLLGIALLAVFLFSLLPSAALANTTAVFAYWIESDTKQLTVVQGEQANFAIVVDSYEKYYLEVGLVDEAGKEKLLFSKTNVQGAFYKFIELDTGTLKPGKYAVNVFALTKNGEDAETLSLTVLASTAGNHKPEFTSTPLTKILEKSSYVYHVKAADADGDTVTFSLMQGPSWLKLSPFKKNEASLMGTVPEVKEDTNYVVTIKATDGKDFELQTFTITVDDGLAKPIPTPTTVAVQLAWKDENTDKETIKQGATATFTVTADSLGEDSMDITVWLRKNGILYKKLIDDFTESDSFTQTFTLDKTIYDDVGIYTVEATVKGASGAKDTASLTLVVEAVVKPAENLPPVLTVPGDQTVTEGQTLTFTVKAKDEGIVAIIPLKMPFPGSTFTDNGNNTGTLTFKPSFDYIQHPASSAVFIAEFTAIDEQFKETKKTVKITVLDKNRVPAFFDTPYSATADEGKTLTFAVKATDADKDFVTLALAAFQKCSTQMLGLCFAWQDVGTPKEAAFAAAAGTGTVASTFTWVPASDQSGSYRVVFSAADKFGGTAVRNIDITVNDVAVANAPPVLVSIGDKTIETGKTLTFKISATDKDNDKLTFSFTKDLSPSSATLTNHGDGTATFSWTPNKSQIGNNPVGFEVSDGKGGKDSETITIKVTSAVLPVNNPPLLTVPDAQVIQEGKPLSFSVTATDPDINDKLTLSTDKATLPQGASFPTTTGKGLVSQTFSWVPAFDQGGEDYTVTFTVTDQNGLKDIKMVKITVLDVTEGNQQPIIQVSGKLVRNEGSDVELGIIAFDPDGDELTLELLPVELPQEAAFVDHGNGLATFNWEEVPFDWVQHPSISRTIVLTFVATEKNTPEKLKETTSVLLTILDNNRGPDIKFIHENKLIISEGYKITAEEGKEILFDVLATDPDGDGIKKLEPINFELCSAFSLFGTCIGDEKSLAEMGATFIKTSQNSGTFIWTPSFGQSGYYRVTFLAEDDFLVEELLIDSEETEKYIDISVESGVPPVKNQPPTFTNSFCQLKKTTVGDEFEPPKGKEGKAMDPEGEELTYELSNKPEGMSIGEKTGKITWKPKEKGTFKFTVAVTDGVNTVQQQCTVKVTSASLAFGISHIGMEETAPANGVFPVLVEVANAGTKKMKDVKITVSIPELSFKKQAGLFTIAPNKEVEKALWVELEDVPAGEYDVLVTASNDQLSHTVWRTIEVTG